MKMDSKKQITVILAIFHKFLSLNNKRKQYNIERFFVKQASSCYFIFYDQEI